MSINPETQRYVFKEGLKKAVEEESEIKGWIEQGLMNNTCGEDCLENLLVLAKNRIREYERILSTFDRNLK
jgi:hypothetical protein